MPTLTAPHTCSACVIAAIFFFFAALAASPAPLLFGQSCVLTGPNAFLGTRMAAGIQAAFLEVNRNGGVGGRNLSLITYDDGYDPAPALNNTLQLLDNDGVFALIGYVGTPTALAALPAAVARSVPFIGAFTGSNGLRKPYNPLMVNLRASYDDETAAMAQLLVGKYSLHRIACFYQNDTFGAAGLSGVTRALNSIGLPLVATGLYTRNTVNVAAGLASISAAGNIQAVVMIGSYSALAQFVQLAKNDTAGFTAGCRFISVSFVGSEALAAALPAWARANVFVTQVVPTPTDNSTSRATVKYRAAMLASEGLATTPDYASFEGYLAGRFVAAVVDRMPQLTRAAMLSVIQQQALFLVDDLPYGLFSPSCASAVAAVSLGCDCTQGARRVWTTQLQSNGSWSQVDNSFQWGLPTCFSPTSLVVAPMSFVASFPVGSVYGQTVSDGIAAAFTASNARNIAAGRSLVLQMRPYAAGTAASESTAINMMLEDVFASGILGGTIESSTADQVNTPILGRLDVSFSSALSDAYAEVKRQQQQQRGTPPRVVGNGTVLLLTPPLEEQILALCEAAFSMRGAGLSLSVAVNASSSVEAQEVVSAALAATQYGALAPIMATLPLSGVVSCDALLLLSESAADAKAALGLLQEGTVRSLLLPINAAAAFVAAVGTDLSTSTAQKVLVARQFDDLSTDASTFLQSEFALDTTSVMNATKRSPAFQQGYLMGRFVAALIARNSGALVSATEFLDLIYRSGTIAIDALSFGPFQRNGIDDCQSGISMFPVQSLDGSWVYRYSRGTACYASFTAIPAPGVVGPAYWAIGVAFGILLVVVLVVLYVVRRHLRLAARPLDGSAPFAVMFVGVKNEAEVRDLGEANANAALAHIRHVVKDAVRATGCFEARRMDDATVMIVAKRAESALECAGYITREVETTDWASILLHPVPNSAKHHLGTPQRPPSVSPPTSSHRSQTSSTRRSASRSHRETTSVHSSHRSLQQASKPLINIGIEYGFGIIDHDEETELISYHGPVVTGAASVADTARHRQILVTREVVEAVEDGGNVTDAVHGKFLSFEPLNAPMPAAAVGESDSTRSNTHYFLFIPDGLPTSYDDSVTKRKKAEFESGGISTALATADVGLARRRVAVVSVYFPDLATQATSDVHEMATLIADLREVSAEYRGVVLNIVGNVVMIGVNCVGPLVSQASARAAALALRLSSGFDDERMSIGVAAGTAVASAGICLGNVCASADAMRHAAKAAKIPIAVAESTHQDLDSKFHLLTVDCIALPHTAEPCRVFAVLSEIVANDEWLYAMNKAEFARENEEGWTKVIKLISCPPEEGEVRVALSTAIEGEITNIQAHPQPSSESAGSVALSASLKRLVILQRLATEDNDTTAPARCWQQRYDEITRPWTTAS